MTVNDVLSGDEVVAVNDVDLSPLTHSEAVGVFKRIKRGRAVLMVRRRAQRRRLTADDSSSRCAIAAALANELKPNSITLASSELAPNKLRTSFERAPN